MTDILTLSVRRQTPSPPRNLLQTAMWACAGPLGLVFAYSCSYNLLLLAPSIYLLQIYDRVLSSRSADTLLMLTLIVALTVVVGGMLDALRRAALGRLGTWLEEYLCPVVLTACFDRAVRADAPRAAEGFRDLIALRQFFESGACPMLFDVFWAPLFLAVLFLVHPLLGTIGAGSALLLFGLALASELLTEAPNGRSSAGLTRSHERLGLAVARIDVIRALGMIDGAARLVHRDAEAARSEHLVAQRRNEIIMLVTKPVRALAQVLVMGSAAWLVLENDRSPAIIFAATLLFGRALAPIEGAIAGWKAFALSAAAYRRLSDILPIDIPGAGADARVPVRLDGGLVVDDVSVAVPGSGGLVLGRVSFRLAPGECLGVIGPSGSGKSLLGRIIAGITVPTHGRVLFGDAEVSVLAHAQNGRNLGYLPQNIELFGETVRDTIARLEDTELQNVIDAAKLAGVHDAIMRLPQAYNTVLPKDDTLPMRSYSQRLGLARAFFGNPRLVVLDEPNASQDYLGERMLFEAVQRLKAAGTTIVIITHRIGILAATDKIAIMKGGMLNAFGESKEIFEKYVSSPLVVAHEGELQPAN